MGWDIAIWGTLKMNASAQEAWRETVVNGRSFKDWKAWFKNASAGEPRTVAEALASWGKRSAKGAELFEVTAKKQSIEVMGYISKDAFIEEARDIATLFRCAESVGATGTITFAGVGLSEAYRLELTEKGSTLKVLDEDLESSPEVQRIAEIAAQRSEAAAATKAAKKTAKKGVKEAAPAPTAATGGAENDVMRRAEAILAQCGANSDEAVKALLAAFDEPAGITNRQWAGMRSPLRDAAARALVATGRQDVFAQILDRLTDKACDIKAGPTGEHVLPEKKSYEKLNYVEGILYVLGHAKYRPAWDRVATVMRTHPLIAVRVAAAGTLARMLEPNEIEAALGEKAETFYARAFQGSAFTAAKPEEVGKKLIAYMKKKK